MATTMMVIAVCVLDSTIVSVALPSIARDFNADAATSIWIINSYQIAILIALIPLASLGEIVGYRRISRRASSSSRSPHSAARSRTRCSS